jgi:hypothetical protein
VKRNKKTLLDELFCAIDIFVEKDPFETVENVEKPLECSQTTKKEEHLKLINLQNITNNCITEDVVMTIEESEAETQLPGSTNNLVNDY